MTHQDFLNKCIEEVKQYTKENILPTLEKPHSDFSVYVVWSCKTLQNSKALLSTTLSDDMYYECTYNGNTNEIYFDAYKKKLNKSIKL